MNKSFATNLLRLLPLLSSPVLLASLEEAPDRGIQLLVLLGAVQILLLTLAVAGLAFLIQLVRKSLSQQETAAPPPRVERLTGFDHSMREVSRQLSEIKNELGGVRNSIQAIEIPLSQLGGETPATGASEETRPGTFQRLGRPDAGKGSVSGPLSVLNVRASVDKYCSGEAGVEGLLEAARKAKRKWGSGRGMAYAPGHAAEVTVDWEQIKNAPLIVIEKDDSAPGAESYWILVNGIKKFSEYLVVAFTEPDPPGGDSLYRTKTPGEGQRIGDDRVRVEKVGEVSPC